MKKIVSIPVFAAALAAVCSAETPVETVKSAYAEAFAAAEKLNAATSEYNDASQALYSARSEFVSLLKEAETRKEKIAALESSFKRCVFIASSDIPGAIAKNRANFAEAAKVAKELEDFFPSGAELAAAAQETVKKLRDYSDKNPRLDDADRRRINSAIASYEAAKKKFFALQYDFRQPATDLQVAETLLGETDGILKSDLNAAEFEKILKDIKAKTDENAKKLEAISADFDRVKVPSEALVSARGKFSDAYCKLNMFAIRALPQICPGASLEGVEYARLRAIKSFGSKTPLSKKYSLNAEAADGAIGKTSLLRGYEGSASGYSKNKTIAANAEAAENAKIAAKGEALELISRLGSFARQFENAAVFLNYKIKFVSDTANSINSAFESVEKLAKAANGHISEAKSLSLETRLFSAKIKKFEKGFEFSKTRVNGGVSAMNAALAESDRGTSRLREKIEKLCASANPPAQSAR